MSTPVFQAITALLDEQGITYRQVHHEPTPTSEAAAAARGEDLSVLSASLKIDSPAIKAHFRAKKLRFASADELLELTGLIPGSVPPFGEPILPFELFVDESIRRNERIAFNAGSLTDSVVMEVEDYLRVAAPVVLEFSKSE
jgi:Ala-tRNA(Pro) deacylase